MNTPEETEFEGREWFSSDGEKKVFLNKKLKKISPFELLFLQPGDFIFHYFWAYIIIKKIENPYGLNGRKQLYRAICMPGDRWIDKEKTEPKVIKSLIPPKAKEAKFYKPEILKLETWTLDNTPYYRISHIKDPNCFNLE